ncbi:MAG: endonuclease III [Candidatus Binataceae bacterium]|nr:endonuclease III [Candidatus Binataceae bacterium]
MPRTTAAARDALGRRAARIAAALARLYPEARISLDFSDAWECLVATILSAQCTDERVNRTTPSLFAAIPDVTAMAQAGLPEIEKLIQVTGFFRQKAKALKGCAIAVVKQFGGKVPRTMEDLVTLPGVGRKTANVIRGHIYGEPGMVVDTHVRRVSFRLGLTVDKEADKIELDLQQLIPPPQWTAFSMRLILHGRRICVARRPRCESCALLPDCPQIGVKF